MDRWKIQSEFAIYFIQFTPTPENHSYLQQFVCSNLGSGFASSISLGAWRAAIPSHSPEKEGSPSSPEIATPLSS